MAQTQLFKIVCTISIETPSGEGPVLHLGGGKVEEQKTTAFTDSDTLDIDPGTPDPITTLSAQFTGTVSPYCPLSSAR